MAAREHDQAAPVVVAIAVCEHHQRTLAARRRAGHGSAQLVELDREAQLPGLTLDRTPERIVPEAAESAVGHQRQHLAGIPAAERQMRAHAKLKRAGAACHAKAEQHCEHDPCNHEATSWAGRVMRRARR